ncbi:MAG: hypothetical protein FI729_02000 [SAR202 cluster bacterium]|nr:hypothetical protein [SAR202 cluster bacterium]|tara:strand:+ start:12882 stop:13892 length:1011 start_codon:yes stop_codon:yes gene_type:complete
MKGIHFYAGPQRNSGDFFLGPATKWEAENKLGSKVEWTYYDVRAKLDTSKVQWINATFDVMVLGGGGLLLPDTNPNDESCWQWPVSSQLISEIKIPIYVIGLGYNLFYDQKVTMPERNNNEYPNRESIFKQNLQTLVSQSRHFSMRHRGDIERLLEIIGEEYRTQITFEFCPVVGYMKNFYRDTMNSDGRYHAFELKDDRANRRYVGTSQNEVYSSLKNYIQYLLDRGEPVAVMSHDGSSSFYNFLIQHNISVPLLDNTSMNQEEIIDNYRKVKRLYCTAGHSQMIAHALDIEYFSLISHDKLEYFLRDVGRFEVNNYCYVRDNQLLDKLKEQYNG